MSGCASTVLRCWRSSRATSRPPTALALPSTIWVTTRTHCATCRRPETGSPQVRGVAAERSRARGWNRVNKGRKVGAQLLQGVLYHTLHLLLLLPHSSTHHASLIFTQPPLIYLLTRFDTSHLAPSLCTHSPSLCTHSLAPLHTVTHSHSHIHLHPPVLPATTCEAFAGS